MSANAARRSNGPWKGGPVVPIDLSATRASCAWTENETRRVGVTVALNRKRLNQYRSSSSFVKPPPANPSMRSRNSPRTRSHDGKTSLARFGNGVVGVVAGTGLGGSRCCAPRPGVSSRPTEARRNFVRIIAFPVEQGTFRIRAAAKRVETLKPRIDFG